MAQMYEHRAFQPQPGDKMKGYRKIIFLDRVTDQRTTVAMTMPLAWCSGFQVILCFPLPLNSQRRLQLFCDSGLGYGLQAHQRGCSLLWRLTDHLER